MKLKDAKTLLDFLRRNGLEFRYWKYDNNLYDIHITNLTLIDLTFTDFENFAEMNFLINDNNSKFLHIFRTSSDIEIDVGDLHSHDKIELEKARITWNRIEGLEILWRAEK